MSTYVGFAVNLFHFAYRLASTLRGLYWRMARPHVYGAKAMAFDDDGRLLLVRHSYGKSDLYMLPGGAIKPGEAAAAAATREIAEETGCRLRDVKLFGRYLDTSKGARNHIHLCTGRASDTPRADGREIVEARFFALDALPANLSDATARRIADWRAGAARDRQW